MNPFKRRNSTQGDQSQVDPATTEQFETIGTGDTQQMPASEPAQPKPRRRLGAGLAVGAVVGLAAGFAIPAIAGGNAATTNDTSLTSSPTPGASDKAAGSKDASDANTDKKAKGPAELCPAPHAGPGKHHKGDPAPKDGAAPSPKSGNAKHLPPTPPKAK